MKQGFLVLPECNSSPIEQPDSPLHMLDHSSLILQHGETHTSNIIYIGGGAANRKRGEGERSKQSHGLGVHSSGRESSRAPEQAEAKDSLGLPLSLSPLHLL